jgi:hypothetical protein
MLEQPALQHLQRLGLVLELRALVLALDDDAGRHVANLHGAVGGVDALAPGAARRGDADVEVLVVDGTSTSSASGSTATVAVDVWMRPCASVAGTRCTRCTPPSKRRRE